MTVAKPSGHCYACGKNVTFEFTKIINDELASAWLLNDKIRAGFDARESMFCPNCRCSFRLRQLAECLTHIYGKESLDELVKDDTFSSMEIAEINSCGVLHTILSKLPALKYSEYGSEDKSIRTESLEKLTYNDEIFDLVLTSDTLEHVPDVPKALGEIMRVLKPGGKHVFTVPIIWGRKTNHRENQAPSYHGAGEPDYLVFNEFGHDMIDVIKSCGFEVDTYKVNVLNLNDVAGVIVATRPRRSLES